MSINPDMQLEAIDRAHLSAITGHPGFAVLHRVMRAEADKFVVALLNADAAQDADVLAKHKLAKAAAQFYAAVTERVNEEVMLYTRAPRASDMPVDAGQGLDFGDVARMAEQLPNLLGGDDE